MGNNDYCEMDRKVNEVNDAEKNGLRALTRGERFGVLVRRVSEAQKELRTANTEDDVNNALDTISTIMYEEYRDWQVSDVKGVVEDIAGTICSVKMHDTTRSDLDDLLEKLLDRAREIIEEERKKEMAKKLEILFLKLAESADDIAKIIDIKEIFG